MLRSSLEAHWIAAGNALSHAGYVLVTAGARRKSAEQAVGKQANVLAAWLTRGGQAAAAGPPPALPATQQAGVGDDTDSDEDEDEPDDDEPPPQRRRRNPEDLLNRLHVSVGNLVGTQTSLPLAVAKKVVELLQEAEAEKERKVAAAADRAAFRRLKGDTFEELAERNGLEISDGYLKCPDCGAQRTTQRGPAGPVGMWCITTRTFNAVKQDVVRHFKSKVHVQAKEVAAQRKKEASDRRQAAFNIMRGIYFLIKEADAHASFERVLVLLQQCGVYIGTINHSRNLVAKVLPSFRRVFERHLLEFLAEPQAVIGKRLVAVGYSADKATIKREKQDMRAVLYPCRKTGELKAVLVRSEPCKSGEGDNESLAKAQLTALEALGIPREQVLQRVGGWVFDGAYIQGENGIFKWLKELTGISPDSTSFVTCFWDLAHLLNRGVEDLLLDKVGTKALQSVDWIITMGDKMSEYSSPFGYGNGHRDGQDIAAETGAEFLNIVAMCDTRFMQWNVRAITVFLRNYKVMVEWYLRKSEIPEGAREGRRRTTRNTAEKRFFNVYCLMRDAAFIGRLLIMREVFTLVMDLSLAAQKVNVWPPELREKEHALLATLSQMSDDLFRLDDKDTRPLVLRPSLWPQLHAAAAASDAGAAGSVPSVWAELQAGRFSGVQLELPHVDDDPKNLQYTWAQTAKLLQEDAGDMVAALHHFLELRLVKGKQAPRQGDKGGHIADVLGAVEGNTIVELAGRALDFRLLAQEGYTPDVEALSKLLDAAAETGVIIEPSGGRPPIAEQLEELHSRLVEAGKELPFRETWFPSGSSSPASCTVFLKDIWTKPELHTGLEDLMYLINHVWVKTKCEAVVEGMGSTIARHGDKYRSSLGQENIEIEAFVAYNFPGLAHPGSKKLMEEVLNDYFGKDEHGKQKPWHFEHTSYGGQHGRNSMSSMVTQRHGAEEAKHEFLC